MGVFEAVMLFCFGASWPMAIYKTYKTRNPIGKSLPFLYLVFIGYTSGILHKYYHARDWVIFLYIINLLMVGIDIILTKYYLAKNKKNKAAAKST
ncbi:MAG: hypothetical protein PHV82_12205 [Victivallaceae bacterium]|nr:hypothetical protein [Victivallaceae bacterium]